MSDVNALIALLMLLAVVFGGVVKVLWARMGSIEQRMNDERVKSAERFVTVEELDRRLEQSLKPVTSQLDKLEGQSERILALLVEDRRGHHRESVNG